MVKTIELNTIANSLIISASHINGHCIVEEGRHYSSKGSDWHRELEKSLANLVDAYEKDGGAVEKHPVLGSVLSLIRPVLDINEIEVVAYVLKPITPRLATRAIKSNVPLTITRVKNPFAEKTKRDLHL